MLIQKEIFNRIKEVMGFTKDKELAEFFEISQSNLATVKCKNRIPWEKIIEKSIGNYNLEYVLFGLESKMEIPNNAKDIVELLKYANPKFLEDTKEKLLKLKEFQENL